MKRPSSRWAWALLVGPLLSALLGCQVVAPKRAPGFDIGQVRSIDLGDTREAVLSTLGEPLQSTTAPSSDSEVLIYAQTGATWLLGEYTISHKGYECLVWLRNSQLEGVRVIHEPSGLLCECSSTRACHPDWADSCIAEVQQSDSAS